MSAAGRSWGPAARAPRAARRRVPAEARPRGLAGFQSWALVVLCLILVGVSGGLLWVLGINYDGLTGSAASKIHPATYLCILLLVLRLLTAGNPVAPLAQALVRRPASVALAATGIALMLVIAARGGTGLAGSLDTFMLPGLLAVLLLDRDATTLRRLEVTFHAVMFANAVLGIVEFGTGQRYFPFRLDGTDFDTDTRSAALQGHPLGNATLTAAYLLALMAGGGRLTGAMRAGIIALQLVALITFGGRSATVATLVFGSGYALAAAARTLAHGRLPLLGLAALAFGLTLIPIAVGGAAVGGFFDTLAGRFVSDGGSANARVEMLAIFDAIPLRELVWGPDLSTIDTLRRMYGLEWGIENPIVKFLLYNGILVTLLLVAVVAAYLVEVAGNCRPGVLVPILAFVILINTFESLGGKTPLLAKFALMLLVLFPRGARRGRRSAPFAAPASRTGDDAPRRVPAVGARPGATGASPA